MISTRAGLAAGKRPQSKPARDDDFTKIPAAVAAAAKRDSAVATAPPVPAGSTAGALLYLVRGGV